MDLSVIIVNYNTADVTINAINSVIDNMGKLSLEIFLVDNHSVESDYYKILKKFGKEIERGIMIPVRNNDNLGFSKANNIGVKLCKGKHILLLNSDTVVKDNVLTKSVEYMDLNPKVGAVSCKLVDRHGKLDHGCKRGNPTPLASFFYFTKISKLFPKNKVISRYTVGWLEEDQIGEVEVISGAYIFFRREIIKNVGLLDESFFMYAEDMDYCLRIRNAGYKIIYNPDLGEVIHLKGESGKKRKSVTRKAFYDSKIIFYNKHYKDKWLSKNFAKAGVRILRWIKG